MMTDCRAAPSLHDEALTSQLARTSANYKRELNSKDFPKYKYFAKANFHFNFFSPPTKCLLLKMIKIIRRAQRLQTSSLIFSLTCFWVTACKLLPRNGLLCFHFVLSPTLSLHPSFYYECFSSGPKIKRTQMSAMLYWCFLTARNPSLTSTHRRGAMLKNTLH